MSSSSENDCAKIFCYLSWEAIKNRFNLILSTGMVKIGLGIFS
jgi:hypothetical protein